MEIFTQRIPAVAYCLRVFLELVSGWNLGKNLRYFCENFPKKKGRNEEPSAGSIDSQSVKIGCKTQIKGFDGGKKVKGRKRHIIVDTEGLPHCTVVLEGNIHDNPASKLVFFKAKEKGLKFLKIWADSAYGGDLINWVKSFLGTILEIVKKPAEGFEVLPRRWVAERTFGWFDNYRCLSKDYERYPKNSENIVHLSMLHMLLNRLDS